MSRHAQPYVEGSGLGEPESQAFIPLSNPGGYRGQSLDWFYARLGPEEISYRDFLKWIAKAGKLPPGDVASVKAIATGLIELRGVLIRTWSYGPVTVQRYPTLAEQRPRKREAQRVYEFVEDVMGSMVPVLRADASAFRRRVRLEKLELAERELVRKAEQLQLLHAEAAAL